MGNSKWMWCPDAFERYHGMLLHNRRTVGGIYVPPMWRIDAPERNLFLYKVAVLDKPETLIFYANTKDASILVDKKRYSQGERVEIPAGRQMVKVYAYKETGFPAVYIEGDTFASDDTWSQGSFGMGDRKAGTNDMYGSLEDNPEIFKFAYKKIVPISCEDILDGKIYDFGKESFGHLIFENITPRETGFKIYCGESREEALDEKFSVVHISAKANEGKFVSESVAFRYVFVPDFGGKYDFYADFEYLPCEDRGAFSCGNAEIDKIYSMAAYTLHLNTREGFLDGIKRDRWVWGGDSYQSFLADYYLMFDTDTVRRTLNILHGAEPITMHVNMIPDYTFYWLISLWEYYLYTGDLKFIKSFYHKIVSTVNFIEKRLDKNGMYEKRQGDWVFIDWANFDVDSGPICAEQMLLCHAYKCASRCMLIAGDEENAARYSEKAEALREKINLLYWDEEKNAFIDDYLTENRNVTRHANIFAILYEITDINRKKLITENVIKNPKIPAITTPYFRFFELAAMSEIGDFAYVNDVLLSYWGGMIKLGATTFWEQYDSSVSGEAHYAMYGRPYDKSLCHAWGGTTPIYISGRYILGVKPTKPGYAEYTVTPCTSLSSLGKISGKVPTPNGDIYVEIDDGKISVLSEIDGGKLIIKENVYVIEKNEKLTVEY